MLAVSCSPNRSVASKSLTSDDRGSYDVVTNAIDRGDWYALRRLAKPGMRANEYIMMWENPARAGHAVRVGKQTSVEKDAELNGQRCTKYSFALETTDGTASVHVLQILVREEDGQPEILDFWNFGW
jgi:hypothetical protein